MKRSVLVFLIRNQSELLMIWKKTGQGKGKWNVPGGKCETGETFEAAAIREFQEETGLRPLRVEKVGDLEFLFPKGGSWPSHCSVFLSRDFEGVLIDETEECRTEWIPLDEIPWKEMWESDCLWVPAILRGEKVSRRYSFDENDRLIADEPLAGN